MGEAYEEASLVAQMVKNLPATWETCVQSLDQEDTLERGMASHSSILAWRIPCPSVLAFSQPGSPLLWQNAQV